VSSDIVAVLADTLVKGGVRNAFGVTGSGSSLRLIQELQAKGVVYHPVAHEGAAAMMAGACCRDGKTRAVAISIKGPGFANFFPGIVSNAYENRPAVTVSEAYGDSVPSWRKHKRLDHRAVGDPVLKGYLEFDGRPASLERLLEGAAREIPGPVHVDLCPKPAAQRSLPPEAKNPGETGPALEAILEKIRNANRPAVVLGSMVARRLSGISWEIGVPVVTTAAAKGCIDESGEYAGGVVTGEVKELSPEQSILGRSDLVVAFGLRGEEVVIPRPFGVPLVLLDVPEVGAQSYEGFEPSTVHLVGNPEESAKRVIEELSRRTWGEEVVRERKRRVEEELFTGGFCLASVYRCLQESLDPGAVLVPDTGLFCTIGETVWIARSPAAFCGSSNGRFMGTSVPTAIGLAAGDGSFPVVCLAGDGGIRPYLPEIRLAVAEKLPVLFVLLSDGAFGTVAQSVLGKELDRSPFTIAHPSWRRAIEEMGCPADQISSLGELGNSVAAWNPSGGPLFLEMSFDPESYARSTINLR
jgi:acetolactate synthase-1/2/3 large subunit